MYGTCSVILQLSRSLYTQEPGSAYPAYQLASAICLNGAEGSQNGLIVTLGTLGIFDLPVWGSKFAGGYAGGGVSANCSE
jgi:hypothetical protein